MIKACLLLVFSLFLFACGDEPAANNGAAPSPKTLAPADPSLAAIYQRSCKACHSRGLSGAPVTGNTQQWQPRIAKGMDMLLAHTIGGFRGMPPRGSCMDCSAKQYQQLIRFMANWPLAEDAAASDAEL